MTSETMGKTLGLAQTESELVTSIGHKLGLTDLESNFLGHLSKKMDMAQTRGVSLAQVNTKL